MIAFSDFYEEIPQKPLNQVDKAATILLAMNKKISGQLLKYFTHVELQAIIASAQSLPEIPLDQLINIVNEFENQFIEGIGLTDNAKTIEIILEEGLSKNEINSLLGREKSFNNYETSIWNRLEAVDPSFIGKFLLGKHPQTAAYILSMLPSSLGAKVLLQFPNEKRTDILKRTGNLKEVNPHVIQVIENCIFTFLSEIESDSNTIGSEKVANLMNELEKPQVDTLLTSLESVSKEAFNKVRSKIFLFEDLIKISPHQLAILFNDIPINTLTTALHGTSTDIREHILSCISTRKRRIIETNISTTETSTNPREIAITRRAIIQEALRLEKAGKIELKRIK